MNKNFNQGITLVALIITIIVLVILATVSIQAITGEGILAKAREAAFKAEMAQLQEDLGLFITNKQILNSGFNANTLNASSQGIYYETSSGVEKQEGDIEVVLPSISKKRKEQIEIIKGEILFSSQNKNELKWAQELGIGINPYNIVEGVLMSSDTNLMLMGEDGVLALPTSITKVADGAFANVTGIKKVIIPGNVKEIGANAFAYNETLEEVVIEDGVETIGAMAFYKCTNLITVEMKDSVSYLGLGTFREDKKLKSITLSNNITELENLTFSDCADLTSIQLPEKLEKIGSNAFGGCVKLVRIVIPQYVNTINNGAFSGCSLLAEIEIDDQNKNFASEDGVIFNKEKTKMIWIAPSAKAIEGHVFTIKSTVTSLGGSLINQYTQITKVIIPESVISIDMDFFTTSLIEVEIDENNPNYEIVSDGLYSIPNQTLVRMISSNASFNIKTGTKMIGEKAFYYKSNLTNVTIPNTVTTIQNAFDACSQLVSITIPSSVTSIESECFGRCSSLTEIIINQKEGAIPGAPWGAPIGDRVKITWNG